MVFTRKFPKSSFGQYLYEFGDGTSLHGLRYIIKPNMHFTETLLWMIAVLSSVAVASSLILNSLQRYNANPTVISLEKDFRNWKIAFPSATVCFLQRLNTSLAADFIYTRWNVEENFTDYKLYYNFLESVTNLTYDNFEDFNNYLGVEELENIKGEEIANIAQTISVDMVYHAKIYNKTFDSMKFEETLTEMGQCYSYSALVSKYLSFQEKPVKTNVSLPFCNYLNSQCYARIDDLPNPIKYYIHSPYEIPDSTNKYFIVTVNMERDTGFRFQETVTSPELRKLDIGQRNCRFLEEPLGNEKVYSHNLCHMVCRKSLAVAYCGCTPHFYTKLKGIPLCDVKGIVCLSKHKDQIRRLIKPNGLKFQCNCLAPCESTIYYLDKEIERHWSYPVPRNIRFKWSIERYSKTRFKRNIIFGLEDLLVSLGGIAAFFLGCSVLSFVELVYFFSLRLIWYLCNRTKQTKVKNTGRVPQWNSSKMF